MLIEKATAPSYATLRPLKPIRSSGFPVYDDLAARMREVEKVPDPTVAHVLAAASGYAYSDAATVSMIMARMGLESNHCLKVAQSVDAMFIESTAYLVQSQDGSVVVLAYRGTQPANLVNWLTDADVHPDQIAFPFPGTEETYAVHAGFYRNVRATRYSVISALQRAMQGRSVLDDGTAAAPLPDGGAMASPMRALYITGHSLGGAMAALMSAMLVTEPEYVAAFRDVFRGAYTFGQPMVGSPAFAAQCDGHELLADHVFRYVYRRDPVPHLPPRDSDRFQHFGREFCYEGSYPWSETTDHPAEQMGFVVELVGAALGFVAGQLRALRSLPLQFSFADHGPQHYVSALTPPGTPNEFGDAHLLPGG
ncbi:MAG TPA: lipase family protein [Nocardioidaceae bacterium]|nr:lipase family protein [Nocardioidaceae bacterium]